MVLCVQRIVIHRGLASPGRQCRRYSIEADERRIPGEMMLDSGSCLQEDCRSRLQTPRLWRLGSERGLRTAIAGYAGRVEIARSRIAGRIPPERRAPACSRFEMALPAHRLPGRCLGLEVRRKRWPFKRMRSGWPRSRGTNGGRTWWRGRPGAQAGPPRGEINAQTA